MKTRINKNTRTTEKSFNFQTNYRWCAVKFSAAVRRAKNFSGGDLKKMSAAAVRRDRCTGLFQTPM